MKAEKDQIRVWVALAVIAVVYTLIALVLPVRRGEVWVLSYVFALAAIGAQVYVIRTAFFRGEGIRSKFYGFPIAKLGAVYLAAQLLSSVFFMALGWIIPIWLPVLLYALMLGAAVIGFIAVDAVREEVERQDVRLVKDVGRMRSLQTRVKIIASKNQMEQVAEPLRKLSEAFRYSDPVSSEETAELEERLTDELAKLQDAVALLDEKRTLVLCGEMERTLFERNAVCKVGKEK